MVSGKWYMPTIGIGPDGILAKQQYEEVCRSAHSNGFIVKPIETGEDDVVPRVGLSFVVGSAQILSPSLQGGLNFLAYADTSDVTVQFLRPGNNEVVSSDPAQVWKSLHDADSLFYLYTNHPGSTFYNLNAKKQERFVRDIIDAAEQTFPAADALTRHSSMMPSYVPFSLKKTVKLYLEDLVIQSLLYPVLYWESLW
jgi:hypothetical protein